jgi:hypothetical protein
VSIVFSGTGTRSGKSASFVFEVKPDAIGCFAIDKDFKRY